MQPKFADRNFEPKYQELFWSKVWVKGIDECWPWQRACRHAGRVAIPVSSYFVYNGLGSIDRRTTNARTLAAILTGLLDPEGDTYVPPCKDPLCCNPLHIAQALLGPHNHHRRKGRPRADDVVDDTGERYNSLYAVSTNRTVRGEKQKDEFLEVLRPLTQGKTVVLRMMEPGFRTTKVINTGMKQKIVILVPGAAMDIEGALLISVIGRGSTIIEAAGTIKVANLVLAGMPEKLAKALVEKLHILFQEST